MRLETERMVIRDFQLDGAADLQEIFGDMLMSLSEIAAQYRIPSEQILTDRIEDFIERYEPM